MAYLALGCPKRYLVREGVVDNNREEEEETERLDGVSVVSVELDRTERYLLTVCGQRVTVWNGQRDRVVLGSLKLHRVGERIVGAVWSANGDRIFAVSFDGVVHVIKVESKNSDEGRKGDGNWLNFGRENNTSYNKSSKTGGDLASEKVDLTVVAEFNLFLSEAEQARTTVTTITSCPAGAIIGTSNGDIVRVSKEGEIRWRVHVPEFLRCDGTLKKMGVYEQGKKMDPTVEDIIYGNGDDSSGGVHAMDFRKELELCGVVLGNGAALLLAFPDGGLSGPEASQSRWLRSQDVVSIALENRRMLATLGLRDGTVDQLHIGYTPGDPCMLMKTLSLSSWHFESEEVGPASVLRWSRDGTALAIGWQKCGMAVWSVSGCRMVWTLRQVGGSGVRKSPALDNIGENTNENGGFFSKDSRVISLEWGPRGYFLWSSEQNNLPSQPSCFIEMPLYRSGVLSNANQSEATRMAMVGYDRVLVLGGVDGTGREVLDWQQLLIPIEYIFHNWPPEFIAVNDQKTHVAVAAARGVAICTISSRRWRLFGDLTQTKRLRCCALAWFRKTLLIFDEIRDKDDSLRYELNFLTREFSASPTAQAPVQIPARPLLVDVRADGYLLVVCVNSLVYLYRLLEDKHKVSCRQCVKMILPTREANSSSDRSRTPGGGISVARIFPPIDLIGFDGTSPESIPTKLMLVRSTGTLVVVDMAQMMSIPLLRKVEQFWYSTPASSPVAPLNSPLTRPAFWAHGDDGVHVCFASEFKNLVEEHLIHPRKRSAEGYVEKWFDPDPEVYPLGVSAESGMVLGVTQRLEVDILGDAGKCTGTQACPKPHSGRCPHLPASIPFYTISVKGQPVLHRLLRHLLLTHEDKVVLEFTLRCLQLPQFVDSLEWLLFEAVCEEDDDVISDAADGTQKSLAPSHRDYLSKVVRFLHYFGEYEDIVVRCARKMESKRWPRLFNEVGEPAALLELCYMSHRFRTAACLLVVLQEMWGYMSTTHHVIRLLDRAVETENYDLAAELRYFLDNAGEATSISSTLRLRYENEVDMPYLYESTEKRPPHPAVFTAVVKKARKLLSAFELRRLITLAVHMDFPLATFLKKEHEEKVVNFKKALIKLHFQFHWSEPRLQDVARALKNFSEDSSERLDHEWTSKDEEATAKEGLGSAFGSYVKSRRFENANCPLHVNGTTDGDTIKGSPKYRLTHAELTYLMRSSFSAGGPADDIAMLCATMLVELPVLTTLIRRNADSDAEKNLKAVLRLSKSPGYSQLSAFLDRDQYQSEEIVAENGEQ